MAPLLNESATSLSLLADLVNTFLRRQDTHQSTLDNLITGVLVPFQLFEETLPFRAVATIAIRDAAHIRRITLERY